MPSLCKLFPKSLHPTTLFQDQEFKGNYEKLIPQQTTAENIVIHFQRQKNGGGEIDHVHIPEKGTAVVTFESSEGLSV